MPFVISLEGIMEATIKQATDLRKEAKYQESRTLLKTLLKNENYAAKAHLHIAWSYDNEGKEQEAHLKGSNKLHRVIAIANDDIWFRPFAGKPDMQAGNKNAF